jgi:hypothetical protein
LKCSAQVFSLRAPTSGSPSSAKDDHGDAGCGSPKPEQWRKHDSVAILGGHFHWADVENFLGRCVRKGWPDENSQTRDEQNDPTYHHCAHPASSGCVFEGQLIRTDARSVPVI